MAMKSLVRYLNTSSVELHITSAPLYEQLAQRAAIHEHDTYEMDLVFSPQ